MMPMAEDGVKKCTVCGEVKPVGMFNLSKAQADGYKHQCRDCQKTIDAEWRKGRKKSVSKKGSGVAIAPGMWDKRKDKEREDPRHVIPHDELVVRTLKDGEWLEWDGSKGTRGEEIFIGGMLEFTEKTK